MYLIVKKCSEAIEEREDDCKVAKVLLIPSEESLYRMWTMRGLSQLKNWMPRLSFYLSYYEYMYMLGVGQWRYATLRHGAFCVSRQHRLYRRWPGRKVSFLYKSLNYI